ncbi:MAG TPA: hypothetical protein VKI62_03925, partial [Bacteroidota bacterium]|nr:hypothetical protein [Bacteroidota bacterium]
MNIATKEGGSKYSGSLGIYGGQYYTNDPKYFPGLDRFTPASIRNFEGNLGGPLIGDNVSFFATGRYINFGGDMYGFNRFNPWNVGYTVPGTNIYNISLHPADGLADSSLVSMNGSQRAYGQGKVTWKITPSLKLNTNFIYDYNKSKPYDQMYFYDPNGIGNNYSYSKTLLMQLTHTLNSSTFYTLGFSYFDKLYRYYLYDLQYGAPDSLGNQYEIVQPGTDRYVSPKLEQVPTAYSFLTGGTDNNNFRRSTITKELKFDLTSQVDQTNLVKFGAEYRRHHLMYDAVTLQPIPSEANIDVTTSSPFIQTMIPPESSPYHDHYDHAPTEFSSYIQDKIEFQNFIVNIGIRYDFFDPDGVVLADES